MLPNLQLVLFLFYFIVKSFKKVLMRHLLISSIVVYHTIIIPNILNKVVDYMELKVVKDWSI